MVGEGQVTYSACVIFAEYVTWFTYSQESSTLVRRSELP